MLPSYSQLLIKRPFDSFQFFEERVILEAKLSGVDRHLLSIMTHRIKCFIRLEHGGGLKNLERFEMK